MTDISELAKAIGYKRIAEGVGVSDQMVYNRVSMGTFPASWFAVICDLSAALDLGAPSRSAFSFKAAAFREVSDQPSSDAIAETAASKTSSSARR